MGKSKLETLFWLQVIALDAPEPVREFKFHPVRRWRVDFAWPSLKVAVELEGGIWTGGRHTRGSGFVADMEKYNALALMGWRLLRFSGDDLRTGVAVNTVAAMLDDCQRTAH